MSVHSTDSAKSVSLILNEMYNFNLSLPLIILKSSFFTMDMIAPFLLQIEQLHSSF